MPAHTHAPLVPGETVTGAEILAHDWSATSLGPIDRWPVSLRSTLGLMLACPTPMFLAWGPELLLFYNDVYRPILGQRLDGALGRPFREVWGHVWDDIEPIVTSTLSGQGQRLTDMKLDLARYGVPEESWWSFSYSPAYDDEGRIAGLFCVTGETTAKVLAERALRQSNEELQRYAYIVSHDLRAPLVNIMGFTKELEETKAEIRAALATHPVADRIDGELGEALGFIQASVTKMDRLIAALLRLSREGQRVWKPEPLAMTAMVQGLADAIRHQTESAGARVTVSSDLPDLTADRLAVEQIFGNLLDNAVKYLSADRPGRIAVSGSRDGARAVYRVEDNGRGIAAGDLSRVFDLFRRAGAQDRPGEGIGLAQVKMTVASLGGHIDLASELDVGTTFTITLPTVSTDRRAGSQGLAADG